MTGDEWVAYVTAAAELDNSDEERRRVCFGLRSSPDFDKHIHVEEKKVPRNSYSGRRIHCEPPCVTQGMGDRLEGIAPSEHPLAFAQQELPHPRGLFLAHLLSLSSIGCCSGAPMQACNSACCADCFPAAAVCAP